MFYDNFLKACNMRNKAPSAVASEIGISKGTVTGGKNGSSPNDATLQKLADYFGVSPSDLLGETNIKVTRGEVLETGGLSPEALRVALAFDRADQRAKDMVRLALEPFGLSAASDKAM